MVESLGQREEEEGTSGVRDVHRFRGGLVFKAHRLLHHPTLGLRVIKKKKRWAARSMRRWGPNSDSVLVTHLPHVCSARTRRVKMPTIIDSVE